MVAIVYLATNTVNGKRYVGATSASLLFRRRRHEWCALRGRHDCRKFHRAIEKYGPGAFEWSILAVFETLEHAFEHEIRLIAATAPEYNLTSGGDGVRGRTVSAEQRARHSQFMKGRKPSPETIELIVAATRGQKRSAEQRERISASRRGKKLSEEHRRNLSLSHKGKTQSAETIAKRMQPRFGVPLSSEHRAKISAALMGHPGSWTGKKRHPESVRLGWETRRRNKEASRVAS